MRRYVIGSFTNTKRAKLQYKLATPPYKRLQR